MKENKPEINKTNKALIKMLHVSKSYGNNAALRDISFKIEPGAFVFVNGPSGAGKSTLLEILACIQKPNSGKIMIGDIDATSLKPRQRIFLRRRIGVVFQDFRLLQNLNVFQNVAMALEVWGQSGAKAKRRVERVLSLVGLENRADNLPKTLSGGEQQRTALARAIVTEPMIILADEPTGNLDWELSQEIIGLLKRINEKGSTVIVATHDRRLMRSIPAGVLTLNGGRVVGVEI